MLKNLTPDYVRRKEEDFSAVSAGHRVGTTFAPNPPEEEDFGSRAEIPSGFYSAIDRKKERGLGKSPPGKKRKHPAPRLQRHQPGMARHLPVGRKTGRGRGGASLDNIGEMPTPPPDLWMMRCFLLTSHPEATFGMNK